MNSDLAIADGVYLYRLIMCIRHNHNNHRCTRLPPHQPCARKFRYGTMKEEAYCPYTIKVPSEEKQKHYHIHKRFPLIP